VCSTNFWSAYTAVLPSKRYCAIGKESGKTNYVKRINNTIRQRWSRLVRDTLSFSKKLANHIGGMWYFIYDYNIQHHIHSARQSSTS
jgi:IS1 family transposase